MNVSELALVIFTIAAQMSVGAFLVLGGVHFFATRYAGVEEADKLSDLALLAIGPVLTLGLLVSVLHLGNPLNAPRAIMNLGTSWLSREILFGILFAGFGFLFAIMQWRKIGSPALRNGVALIAAALGVGLVFSMAMVYYSLPAVPAWNTWVTPASFFTTTLLLGAMAISAAFVAAYAYLNIRNQTQSEKQRAILAITLRWMALISLVMLGLHFVIQPLYLAYLAVSGPTAEASASILIRQFGLLFATRQVLLFLGAGIFSLFTYIVARDAKNFRLVSTLAYTAFALVLVGEVIGRYLFYASFARIGPL
ncbi:MAG: dimethyl sulfoxide reductase anchor subunit [Caldilineaceae bacterium]|nr:dimethyl sulfoxide reductase anchor subunit [Caldilineaceae bacterium]